LRYGILVSNIRFLKRINGIRIDQCVLKVVGEKPLHPETKRVYNESERPLDSRTNKPWLSNSPVKYCIDPKNKKPYKEGKKPLDPFTQKPVGTESLGNHWKLVIKNTIKRTETIQLLSLSCENDNYEDFIRQNKYTEDEHTLFSKKKSSFWNSSLQENGLQYEFRIQRKEGGIPKLTKTATLEKEGGKMVAKYSPNSVLEKSFYNDIEEDYLKIVKPKEWVHESIKPTTISKNRAINYL
jgi:hypothetical protein